MHRARKLGVTHTGLVESWVGTVLFQKSDASIMAREIIFYYLRTISFASSAGQIASMAPVV